MNKNLSHFQESWEKLVNKALKNYECLTPSERIRYNVSALIGQVLNGGIISHYYNSGADNNRETIQDLNALGFSDLSGLLIQVNKLFLQDYPPTDINERNRIISSWDDWTDDRLDHFFQQLDEKFYDREQELEDALVQHIISNELDEI